MNIDGRLKINEQISEEAAEWFVEFRTGDLDSTGRHVFDTWVRSSPEHLRAFLEVAAIWNEGSALDAQGELDIETLTARVHAEGNVLPLLTRVIATNCNIELQRALPAQSMDAPRRRRWHRYTVAASMLIALAAAALFGWDQLYLEPTYATSLGEQRSITLADGSKVELNSGSRLRVRFTHSLRTVELEQGQALFQVTKNVGRPFIVRSGATQVRAVGTQFDVNRTPTATIVTVLEGRVAVSDPVAHASQADTSGGIYLAAGEQVSVSPRSASKPTHANVAQTTAWTHQRVLLDSATLATVAQEFNRYSVRKLTVQDTGATPLRLSGVFTTDPNFLIEYLRARPDITIVESDTEVHIIRRAQ